MVDAITFEIGGFPSAELLLASSEGLTPLSLPLPSQDSVRRFQTAFEDSDYSLVEPELSNGKGVVAAEKPVTSEKVGFSAGLTELRIANPNSVHDIDPIVQENSFDVQVPVHDYSTPVSAFDPTREVKPVMVEASVEQPDIPVSLASPNSVKESAPVVIDSNPVVKESNTVVKDIAPVVQDSVRVVQAPVRDYSTPVSAFEPAREVKPVIAETPVERPDVPVSITNPAKETVELSRSQDVRVEVAPEKPVQEMPIQEKPIQEKPILKEPFIEKSVPEKSVPEKPVLEKPVSGKLETEKPQSVDKPQVLVAAPISAPPADIAAIPQSVEVQQVASIDSARTEAVVSKVAKAVEIVNRIVETIVSEISVTPALAQGDGEVLITLKPTVLDGSELRLTAKAGELTVSIAPTTVESAQIVQQNLPRLETALAEHAPSFHHVAVVIANAKKGKEK